MVAYADTAGDLKPPIELFAIEQLVAPGEVAAWPLLPSLRYHPAPGEFAESDLQLPWNQDWGAAPAIVGELARQVGAKVPGRLVASAKSWLSHAGVDRLAPILPWGAEESVAKVSPVAASASYLAHVRSAWQQRFPKYPLEQQDLVLTVPASFDEAARQLTVAAARSAGLFQARLLEEPQAACYDWLHRHREELEAVLGDTRLLLVCDVGGGTTDLTLIQVALTANGPQLTRIGVGDHLMLGGDNMDLTLAHRVEQRLGDGDGRLSTASLSQLVQQCRAAKERLLGPDPPERTTVTVLGTGARLIRGSRSAELTCAEVREWLVDGFFPKVGLADRPQGRRGGIVEFGLPYVADPAVSRHLAAFLAKHGEASRQALGDRAPPQTATPVPDAVLLNGGVFHSHALTQRLLEILADWRGVPLLQLSNSHPDLAVARGAVAYGLVRRGQGLRIGGGSPRSYFLLVDNGGRKRGVCLLPRGTEEDREIRLDDRSFSLRLGQPVRFHLLSSTAATPFQAGDVIAIEAENFTMLPPIATVLGGGGENGEVPVQLAAILTEVGTLEMSCVAVDDPGKRWQLAFQLRGDEDAVVVAASTHPRFAEATVLIERFYGPRVKDVIPREIKTLRTELEHILGKRENWDSALLRALFDVLWKGARRRRRSADHERLWLSLAGYSLRPGFGYPLDDWRIQQLWSLYEQGVQYGNDAQVWSEWWTLWRRVAGGLDQASQERILSDILPELKPQPEKAHRGGKSARKPGVEDRIRLVASLERIPALRKVEVGEILLQRLQSRGESPQTWWAVGRLGARVPLYGSAHNVVPKAMAARWLEPIFQLDWKAVQPAAFAATLLARLSGDRERDIEAGPRAQLVQRLRALRAPESWIRMVSEVTELEEGDQQRVYGEALPPGLRLVQ